MLCVPPCDRHLWPWFCRLQPQSRPAAGLPSVHIGHLPQPGLWAVNSLLPLQRPACQGPSLWSEPLSPRLLPEKASCVASGSLSGPAARRVCGGHWQPLCPAEHCDDGHCQHCPAGWQGAGPPGLRHGLYPDRCHHQCESCGQG